jgi:hypothetical protein
LRIGTEASPLPSNKGKSKRAKSKRKALVTELPNVVSILKSETYEERLLRTQGELNLKSVKSSSPKKVNAIP